MQCVPIYEWEKLICNEAPFLYRSQIYCILNGRFLLWKKKKTQKTSLWDKIRGMFFSEIALLVTESFHLLMFGQKIFVCLEKALNIKV